MSSRYYLLLYNLLSLLAWIYLTAHVSSNTIKSLTEASAAEYESAALRTEISIVTAVQSVAALEILHAALGLVRASPGAAALQIGGRNLVLWTVVRRFPELFIPLGSRRGGENGEYGPAALRACLLAWGCSDILRYALFVAVSLWGRAPAWLRWLRYTAFIVLYPIGFLSEASLVYLGLVKASGIGPFYRGYLFVGLLSYIPASYFLYTYMFSQRRRALGQVDRVKNI
ncbi:PTPLA-domain-containing protein [Xylaria sp. FL0933]|nr:PTPLA-domain-containing protein [Xylaria sp. FL0933]